MPPSVIGSADGARLGRRSLLGALGVAAVGGFATAASAQENAGAYSLVQGEACSAVVPLEGDEPVEALYDYRVPEEFGGDNGASDPGEGPYFQSNGTTDLQRESVTITFLYRGPEGFSLVVVHDSAAGDDAGGAVSWTIDGVPGDAAWVVKDDLYLDGGDQADANYDNWDLDGDAHSVDWTWGSAGTDGGALRTGDSALELTIDPAFNEASALWGEHYAEDPIEDWQLLSFPDGRESPERTSLALDEPAVLRAAPCGEPSGERDDADGERPDSEEAIVVEIYLRIGSFSLRRRGSIPVGVRVAEALDPGDIDVGSLRFGPPRAIERGGGARPVRDGADDELLFRFPTGAAGFEFGDTTAKLVGRTEDGRRLVGTTGVSLDDRKGADSEPADEGDEGAERDGVLGGWF